MNKFNLFILFLLPIVCYAETYQCIDDAGRVIFKDTECGVTEAYLKPIETSMDKESVIDEPAENVGIQDDESGKVIFRDHRALTPPYKIKVHEVKVVNETEDRLIVDVIYTYKHEIPADEIKIFVLPNHGYWSVNSSKALVGKNVMRASIGLSKSNMKKDFVTRSHTDTLNITFDHYSPKKYNGVIWSKLIKYNKHWKLKS